MCSALAACHADVVHGVAPGLPGEAVPGVVLSVILPLSQQTKILQQKGENSKMIIYINWCNTEEI